MAKKWLIKSDDYCLRLEAASDFSKEDMPRFDRTSLVVNGFARRFGLRAHGAITLQFTHHRPDRFSQLRPIADGDGYATGMAGDQARDFPVVPTNK